MYTLLIASLLGLPAAQAQTLFAPGENGCAETLNIKTHQAIRRGKECGVVALPCSTFKIALAAIAFKEGKITPDEKFVWDGKKREREALNRNQDLYSWMKESVVWVSDVVAKRIGQPVLHRYLQTVNYGNAETGADEFWIHGPLKISPQQQVVYLARTDDKNLERALELLPEEHAGDYEIRGKTGTCKLEGGKQIGWYVGRATSKDKQIAFAVKFTDENGHKTKGPAGFRARKIALDLFSSRTIE